MADGLRVFAEGILADVTDDGNTYLPRPIDRNWGDFLNLFIDVGLADGVVARVGRQELLYGAERLVSPLDWANTRRTFDGARLLTAGDGWTADLFYTYVVPVVANRLDEPDYNQTFYGAYGTVAVSDNLSVDLYYLGYDDRRVAPGGDFSIHTCG
ncbi:MAG TPA: alginate export family protein, partial [Lacipirellulaceae bacterium]|nr:alginate export family protein [Lacipirellulaceae bacterium]